LSDERKDLTEKIRWLLLLRVIILSFFLGAAALFHFFKPEGDPQFFYTLSVPLIIAYAISIGSALLLPRLVDLRLFTYLQLDFDVLLISGIIWITGDAASPFSFLYNLAVMNGAILLFYRGAFFTAGFSSLCYPGLIILSNGYAGGTEKLLKEKQLDYQQLDALKEALLQGVGSGVAVTDAEGRINYFNAQAQDLTSLQEAMVKGKKLDEIFPGLAYKFDGRKRSKNLVADEIQFASPQGTHKQLRLTLAPLSNPSEELIGYISIFEDISKQKEFEEKVRLEDELRRAREVDLPGKKGRLDGSPFYFEGVIGKSGGMERICHLIEKVAEGNANVLITGESGTGKELVARAIHFNGPRKDRPFVAVNCGAIPETLIESELFGHVRGAFTGAVSDHIGLFKQADQGTIFLDEVGELPLHLQVKLLRVLQEKTFTAVGASNPVKVDVRVISATNKDLRKEMEEARFREDLFYRLNVVHMVMPPLRSRKDDIPALGQYFLRKFAASQGKNVEEISSGALMQILSYSFPGNVRELENIIEHAVAITNKNILTEDDLPSHVKGTPIAEEAEIFEKTVPGGAETFFAKGLSLDTELETHEKCILLGALKRSKGVQKRAAELLGINYRSLRHRLEKYGMLSSKAYEFAEDAGEGD